MADPLITLEQLKLLTGKPATASPEDPMLEASIVSASALVRNFTGMRFELSSGSVATERSFEYDGSGYLDIDECQTITNMVMQAGYTGSTPSTLTTDEWYAQPLNLPVKLWVRLVGAFGYRGISPEMGFTYNLDMLYDRLPAKPLIAKVTGVWGWPEIPADVQQATVWTASSIYDTPKPYTQESIADYSRTRGGDAGYEAIPDRAQVALMPYIVPRV